MTREDTQKTAAEAAPAQSSAPAPESAPGAPADAPAQAPAADTLPDLGAALRAAELKAAEHHDAWLRAKAEVDNTRRRAAEDVAKASKFAVEKFADALLPVKDSLEATLIAESATLDTLREGVELTLKQLASAFQSARIVELNPAGERFDPNFHQAISAIDSDGEPNRVLNVLQKGYAIHDRVLRPALVVVSKSKDGGAAG